jgi:hypothetical protein
LRVTHLAYEIETEGRDVEDDAEDGEKMPKFTDQWGRKFMKKRELSFRLADARRRTAPNPHAVETRLSMPMRQIGA